MPAKAGFRLVDAMGVTAVQGLNASTATLRAVENVDGLSPDLVLQVYSL